MGHWGHHRDRRGGVPHPEGRDFGQGGQSGSAFQIPAAAPGKVAWTQGHRAALPSAVCRSDRQPGC